MAHAHPHPGEDHSGYVAPPALRRLLTLIVVPLVLATVAGLAVLWPRGDGPSLGAGIGVADDLVPATVRSREVVPCEGGGGGEPGEDEGSADEAANPADAVRCTLLEIEITEGIDEGQTIALDFVESPRTPSIAEGDRIVLGYESDAEPGSEYFYADRQRGRPLLLLTALFALAVVALGRWGGVRALVALGLSLLVIVSFLLPALLRGSSPLAVAVVAASAIMILALYLSHGVTVRTTTALLGTLASLIVTGLLAASFVAAGRFTGLASEEATFLSAVAGQIELDGLLLAGVIIGSLGVLDDVTVTQASAVWELHLANPAYRARDLYSAALRIGRDHIASTVNTLVLAYAGASLPLLVLFSLANRDLGDVLTGEVVAQEVVRTLVGSVGLVASVPITTGLAAWIVTRPAAEDPSLLAEGA
ncbi:MAG TPA: YibE/F family protein [Mycobacteriales bacterium]|nr:YibE/F family protein [Mycobacteriales bacterium]